MSLASFAFSAAKTLWLCINISLHPFRLMCAEGQAFGSGLTH